MKTKLAVVIQRYGDEVLGGAESFGRDVVLRLADHFEVTVLTSCALDYVSWANHFPPGETRDGKVRVIRFPVKFQRPQRAFRLLSRLLLSPRLTWLPKTRWMERLWLIAQGPYCPDLPQFLRTENTSFDAFLFFTYLYYTTVAGVPAAGRNTVLVPQAHDEPPIRLSMYRDLFTEASALVFQTPEEREFVFRTLVRSERLYRFARPGLPREWETVYRPDEASVSRFLHIRGLTQPYFLYLGRVEPGKGCDLMFSHFLRYREEYGKDVNLVVAGSRQMRIPDSPSIRYLGILPEADKPLALAGSRGLILLSPFESFSMSVQEAFAANRPIIVTSASEVLRGHVERSGGGFAVGNYAEFRNAMNQLLTNEYLEKGSSGARYVRSLHVDDRCERPFVELIQDVKRAR